jgi:uroporphyrinogen-III synthase
MKQFTGSCTAQLLQTPLAVISQRVADRAMDLGFKSILITKSANDNDVIAALRQWHLKRNLS